MYKFKPEQQRYTEYAEIYDKEATQTEQAIQAKRMKEAQQQQALKPQGRNPVQQQKKNAAQGVGVKSFRENQVT